MSTFPAVFYQFLEDAENPSQFLDDPTIEAGDFQISNGGGPFANLAILPVVDPTGSPQVKFEITQNERTNPGALIYGKDQTDPTQWRQIVFTPSDCTPETTNTVVEGTNPVSAPRASITSRPDTRIIRGSGG